MRTGLQAQQIQRVPKTPPKPNQRQKLQMPQHQVIRKRHQKMVQKLQLLPKRDQQRKMPSLLLKTMYPHQKRRHPQKGKNPQKTDQTLVLISCCSRDWRRCRG